MKKLFAAIALCAVVCCAGAAFAAYPEKPVHVIVPSTAGGGTDVMARLLAKFGEKYLGAPMVVDNMPGAGGMIGFHLTAHVSAKRAKYTLDDFDYIGNLVTDPGIIVVPGNSPIKDLAGLADFAKKNENCTASTSGPGGDDDFARLACQSDLGIKLRAVPSKGSSAAKANVMGGHVTVGFMNVSQVEAQVKSGEMRALGVQLEHVHLLPLQKQEQ